MRRSLARLFHDRLIDPLVELVAARLAARIALDHALPAAESAPVPWPEITNGDYVLWAYRLLLGREPEQPEYLASHVYAGDRRRLIQEFLNSLEFQVNMTEIVPPPAVSGYFLTELEDGLRFWVNLRDEHVSRGIICGMWEPAETAFIAAQLQEGMSALDIGANLGWFTVQMSRRVGPSGRVTAFEPRGDLFHYLAKTVAENRLPNVTLHNCALGAASGKANIHWAISDLNPGGTQLVPAGRDPQSLTGGYRVEKVAMTTLDESVRAPVDFIKIDVEGAEKLVFAGATRMLTEHRPIIMSEIAPASLLEISGVSVDDYLRCFEEQDYVVRAILPDGATGPVIRPDHAIEPDQIVNVALFPREKDPDS